jgi:hypothetical protein
MRSCSNADPPGAIPAQIRARAPRRHVDTEKVKQLVDRYVGASADSVRALSKHPDDPARHAT